MASPDANKIDEGLSKVAHAIRRSTALTVAMNITPPESSIDEMLHTADRLAEWLRGSAEDRPRWTPPGVT